MQVISNQQKIHLLPENIIDQIKAGEVIERPATLLKELLENSLDAGATKIKITIENNGLDLICVEDNGHGISYEDLPLAFYRHATSKIQKFEDLYNLFSYGFRGEALASMASVSKITCASSNKHESSVIKVEGGQIISHQRLENHKPHTGTEIYVKDLFYNTPVRLKFVGSKTSEKNQLKKMIASFILTRPQAEFSFKFDDSVRKTFPVEKNFIDRINSLLFPKTPIKFFNSVKTYDDISVEVYISQNSSRGNAGKQQFIFVNDRYVQDATIHKIICNSAAHLWPHGEVGHYIAFIKLQPHMIDVNVHPNKISVKFHTPSKVHALVSQTVKDIQRPVVARAQNSSERIESPFQPDPTDESINNTLYSFEYQGSQFEHLKNENPVRQSIFNFHSLTNRFAIVQIQEKQCLVDLLALALLQLSKTNADSPQTPLMVSEPIRNIQNPVEEKHLNLLAQRGIELDKIGEQTIVLRAHPSSLEAYHCASLIEALLKMHNFDQPLNYNQMLNNTKGFNPATPLVNSSYDLQKLISQLTLSAAVELKVARELNDESLAKLFI